MSAKVTVLGGSSPFTIALVDALGDSVHGIPPAELVLQGRSTSALEQVAGYAVRRLGDCGWRVSFATDQDIALDGADIVIHQIRYGGMEGRQDDEDLAAACCLPPDETLGPAGFQAALRAADELRQLARRVGQRAPQAWMLNLTNPLSVSTAILAREIGPKCIGLCELPWDTICQACEMLDLSSEDVRWNYTGLNHRGFIYRLEHDGEDMLSRLMQLPDDISICGCSSQIVRELGALPLKYFRLMQGKEVLIPGRAQTLEELRGTILKELAAHPAQRPASLALRAMPWYDMAVAPVVATILKGESRTHVVNFLDGAVARELPVRISATGLYPVDQSLPGPRVAAWLDRFSEHEAAVMRAVDDPTPNHIAEAVRLDPLTPADKAAEVDRRLVERWSRSEPSRMRDRQYE